MSILPKIDLPTYTVILPVSKTEVTFRPYVSKEQKILLMAIESGEPESIVNAINQIITNCVISALNINNIPIVDTEFLFYQLRSRSESEIIDLTYRCEIKNEEGKSCGNILPIEFNLLQDLDFGSIENSTLSNVIELPGNKGIKLNYISFNDKEVGDNPTPDDIFNFYTDHVDSIYDEDSVYSREDISKKELKEWIENLSVESFSKLEEFFHNQPKIKKSMHVRCKK